LPIGGFPVGGRERLGWSCSPAAAVRRGRPLSAAARELGAGGAFFGGGGTDASESPGGDPEAARVFT
jgi:hypothetical protein